MQFYPDQANGFPASRLVHRRMREMTRRYFEGEYDGNDEMQKWFRLFFMYLGTEQVNRYACP